MSRRLAPDARRAELIELGKAMFSSAPFDAVSTDEVAKLAGISKGLLYHYFGSKRGFYQATVEALADDLLAVTRLDDDGPLDEALPRVLRAFHAFLSQHGVLYLTLMRGGIGRDDATEAIVESVRATMVRRIVGRLGVSVDDGGLELRLRGWIGAAEAVGAEVVQRGSVDAETFVAVLVDLLKGALGSRHG